MENNTLKNIVSNTNNSIDSDDSISEIFNEFKRTLTEIKIDMSLTFPIINNPFIKSEYNKIIIKNDYTYLQLIVNNTISLIIIFYKNTIYNLVILHDGIYFDRSTNHELVFLLYNNGIAIDVFENHFIIMRYYKDGNNYYDYYNNLLHELATQFSYTKNISTVLENTTNNLYSKSRFVSTIMKHKLGKTINYTLCSDNYIYITSDNMVYRITPDYDFQIYNPDSEYLYINSIFEYNSLIYGLTKEGKKIQIDTNKFNTV